MHILSHALPYTQCRDIDVEILSAVRSCLSEELASTDDASKAAKPPQLLPGAAKLSASVLWQGSPAPPAPESLIRLRDRILCPYHRTLELIVKPGICAVLRGSLAGHFKVAEVRAGDPAAGWHDGQNHMGVHASHGIRAHCVVPSPPCSPLEGAPSPTWESPQCHIHSFPCPLSLLVSPAA